MIGEKTKQEEATIIANILPDNPVAVADDDDAGTWVTVGCSLKTPLSFLLLVYSLHHRHHYNHHLRQHHHHHHWDD
ncbi:hypothetical protein M0802_000342 [Mischocyttarus mexicanus]|nr:hypothetical protein M0802_000342 [Mischocyttarus mexicanus]